MNVEDCNRVEARQGVGCCGAANQGVDIVEGEAGANFVASKTIQVAQPGEGDGTSRGQGAEIERICARAAYQTFDIRPGVGDVDSGAGDMHRTDRKVQIHRGGREIERVAACAGGFEDVVGIRVVAEDVDIITAQARQGVVPGVAGNHIRTGVAGQEISGAATGDIFNLADAVGGIPIDAGRLPGGQIHCYRCGEVGVIEHVRAQAAIDQARE